MGRVNLPDNFRPNTIYNARISSGKVVEAVRLLKTGIGFDGIHSNHFKFISNFTILYLTRFINACFIHNYFPRAILSDAVTPIEKNKSSSLCCSQNYREVVISSNFLKLIEYILLPVLKNFTRISSDTERKCQVFQRVLDLFLKFTISCLHSPFLATFPEALPLPIYFATVAVATLISSACDKPQNSVSLSFISICNFFLFEYFARHC